MEAADIAAVCKCREKKNRARSIVDYHMRKLQNRCSEDDHNRKMHDLEIFKLAFAREDYDEMSDTLDRGYVDLEELFREFSPTPTGFAGQVGQSKLSYLQMAIRDGSQQLVIFLLKKGAQTQTKDSDSRSAMHYATNPGKLVSLRYLVGVGANVNVENRSGFTPLFLACRHGEVDAVKFLIKSKASVQIADRFFS